MSTSPLIGDPLQLPAANAPDVSNLPPTSRGPSFQNPTVAPPPSKPPSLLASILMGAVHGLAGSAGARTFGAGLAGGAAGELNAQQQELQNQRQQEADDRAKQAADTEDQVRKAQLANAQVQSQILATQLHQMDPSRPEYVQKFVAGLANQTDEAIKAGANVKTPTFKTAAELQQYLHDNHIGNGDFAVMPKALHDEKGGIVYAGVEFPNSMNTQPVTIQHLGPTGKMETTTIPAGRISLQDYNHAVVAQQQKDVQNEYDSYKVDQQNKRAAAKAAGGGGTPTLTASIDPNSNSILAQTGLSLPAFSVLTGNSSQLPRDKATRAEAMKEAQQWAVKRGVDTSTIASQYKANNEVLQKNIERAANTKIMENELQGTIGNLEQVAKDKDLGALNFANVVKIWNGQQVNDNLAQQYAVHLNQLRTELTAYNAATQGRTGNNITQADKEEADKVIRNGISSGSLEGLKQAVENSTGKMQGVMQKSVDAANKAVWELFGVGDKFKGSGSKATNKDPLGIR